MAGIAYHQYRALNEISRTLRVLNRAGFGFGTEPYQAVWRMRGELMGKLGLRTYKAVNILKLLTALSPGSIKLYLDSETGWFTEARKEPGARPVFRKVSDQVAISLLRDELTHELEEVLMTPDDYIGE